MEEFLLLVGMSMLLLSGGLSIGIFTATGFSLTTGGVATLYGALKSVV